MYMQQIKTLISILSQSRINTIFDWWTFRTSAQWRNTAMNKERNFHVFEEACTIFKAILRNCLIIPIIFHLFRTISKILAYSQASPTDVLSKPPPPRKRKRKQQIIFHFMTQVSKIFRCQASMKEGEKTLCLKSSRLLRPTYSHAK